MEKELNRLSRRGFIKAGLSAVALTTLFGCAPKPAGPTKAPEATSAPAATAVPEATAVPPASGAKGSVIVFECCWNEEHIKAGKELYNKFRSDHPDIQVEDFWPLATTGWTEQLLAKTAAGEQVDIIWWCASHFKFAEEKRLLDLKPFVDKDGTYKLEDYQTAGVDFCFDKPGRAGAMWGVPTNYATNLLFYNTKMFDAAGVPYPTTDWTWDDLLAAALKFTKDENGDGVNDIWGVTIYGMDGWYWQHVLVSNGGNYVVVDGDGCLLDKPESVSTLQWIQDLMYTHKVMPRQADLAAMGVTAMFSSGKAAMAIGPEWVRYEVAPAHEKEGFEYGVALLPKGSKGRVTGYWPGITSVTSQAKSPEAAWAVAKWISGDEYQRRMTVEIPESPAARIETSTYGFTEGLKYPEDRSAYLESPKYGYLYYNNLRYGKEVYDIIEPGLDQCWQGAKKPAEVVGEICQAVNAKIAELKAAAPKS